MGALAGHLGPSKPTSLDRMTALLAHRGRGGVATHVAPSWSLASLVDKKTRKASVAEHEGVHAVFDGRLLNGKELAKRFRVASGDPADVIARGFRELGPEVFSLLDGPFVVAVHDDGVLHLARDPLGERPLYYANVGSGKGAAMLFATEIKAFLGDDRFTVRPRLGSLNKILAFSFIPGKDSMFEDVFELEPGQRLVCAPGKSPQAYVYWDLAETVAAGDEASCIEAIRTLTRAAVEKRLEGRTKVGAFLSGGIDSSAVVALLAERGVSVTAWSASFGVGQPNELVYARLVAQHCGKLVEHRVVDVVPDDFLDVLPEIMWQLDDPLCDCITVPNYVLAQTAAKEVDLVFNGEGGDPLFGGPKNKFLILGEWYAFLGNYDRSRAYLSSYHKFFDYIGALYTKDFQAKTGGQEPLLDLVRPYMDNTEISHFLNRLMHVNIKLKGGQNILVKVDKMLGANGVTAASPLFDKTLTEQTFAMAPSLKRRGDVEKFVFKKAMEDVLPRAVVYRKKAGMGVPLNHWFKFTALRDYAHDLLTSKRARARGYFEPRFVDALLAGKGPEHAIGQYRGGELLWMLLAVELWHRVYVDGDRPKASTK
ncbi:asparagine synthase (glutamine-hydrolyzing) [soil metagenome]